MPPRVARRRVCAAAASSKTAAARDLWSYDSSAVSSIQLESFKVFHRLSFGHRNARTYVIVVYDPASRACRAMETEVERLATGLRHCPTVRVAKLDASSPEAAAFLNAAFGGRLAERRLPAVLLYPEAATGYVRLKGRYATAEDMLRGINRMYGVSLPHRAPLELQGLPEIALTGEAVAAGMEAAQDPELMKAALDRKKRRDQFRQLLEDVADARDAAAAKAAAVDGPAAGVVAAAAAGEQRAASVSVAPAAAGAGYWTRDKAMLWGALVVISALTFAWDAGLSAVWDRWQLERRQRKRARGVQYDKEQDMEDLGTILYDGLAEDRVLVPRDSSSSSTTAGAAAAGQGEVQQAAGLPGRMAAGGTAGTSGDASQGDAGPPHSGGPAGGNGAPPSGRERH
ncbi:hypothetical protein HXX76_012765 [Chlamydomonas incerta]|uniref:Thioredoxin domain-containing protein n=1 Tax=Chlamydomonas incerta TaxID=51695 RepID=A0A835SW63_CHLIN|nr:hypothetical protein HXX76_012765 [Chlamydomonas incerta]|eukprot:KAG2426981.1 hypothetical protein HXX76_012765 [Chlamydomonas incerta]